MAKRIWSGTHTINLQNFHHKNPSQFDTFDRKFSHFLTFSETFFNMMKAKANKTTKEVKREKQRRRQKTSNQNKKEWKLKRRTL